ncbi:hypothetical protein BSKO_05377 [Bryopsis sp. KO-2023]|nr:hypothetical protein BSKO_05377 [Bryopsis sp. KO-2023]
MVLETESHEQLSQRMAAYISGGLTCNMVCLGDDLGIYAGMKALGKATSQKLADRLNLSERWVREWLYQQAAARLITTDADAHEFWMTKVQEDILVNENGPDGSAYFMTGAAQSVPPSIRANDARMEAFKTGKGLTYDNYGPEMAHAVCRDLTVWIRHSLVEMLCTVPGLKDALEKGIHVADIGCGCGEALMIVAKTFPASTFHGYDISTHALDVANKHKGKNKEYSNTAFFNPSQGQPMPSTPTYDFMYTMDAIHDMSHPHKVLLQARMALKEQSFGYLICDVDGKETPAENIHGDPDTARLFYGYSLSLCMPSGLSEPNGMGLGTLGFTKRVAKELTSQAGFSDYVELDFERPMMKFILVKH